MELDFYLENGFKYVGKFTKDLSSKYVRKTTYSVVGGLDNVAGVYILVDKDGNIVKIGETQGMASRIRLYAQGGQATNRYLREQLEDGESFKVYFYQAKFIETTFAGVHSRIIEDYKQAEGLLIDQYVDANEGNLPRFNKSRK